MKRCKHCNAPLPNDALFCPYCETELVEKMQLSVPKPRHWRKILPLLLLAVLILAGLCTLKGRMDLEPPVKEPAPSAAEEPALAEPEAVSEVAVESASTPEPQAKAAFTPEPQFEYWYETQNGPAYLLNLVCLDEAGRKATLSDSEKARFPVPLNGTSQAVCLLYALPEDYLTGTENAPPPRGRDAPPAPAGHTTTIPPYPS